MLTNEPSPHENWRVPQAVVNTNTATGGKISVEYNTIGSPADPPLLLISGYTAQLTSWADGFCGELADFGRFVIRFDNRDCGLSTKLEGVEVDLDAVIVAALDDRPDLLPAVPYTLSDMAADAIGLLDHLGIEAAHVVGQSLGGMIAQTIAIEHPARLRTMVSIMSSPGDPEVSMPTPEAAAALLGPVATDRAAYIESCVDTLVYRSKQYADPATLKVEYARDYDRSFFPDGGPRQLAAMYASGRRSPMLPGIDTPTLVIHGRDDTLIPPSAGFRTAELIPGSGLLFLSDMGHDLPEPLWPTIVDAIISHTNR